LLLTHFELWGVVDGSDSAPAASDVAILIAWKLRDSKARLELVIYYSEKAINIPTITSNL